MSFVSGTEKKNIVFAVDRFFSMFPYIFFFFWYYVCDVFGYKENWIFIRKYILLYNQKNVLNCIHPLQKKKTTKKANLTHIKQCYTFFVSTYLAAKG